MRILHIVPGLTDEANGIAVVARRLAREQRQLGHAVECAERFARSDYRRADLVFVHSCWTPTVWRGCLGALHAGTRLVRMPHGCLDPARLAYHSWKKRFVAPFEKWLWLRTDCAVATCAAEEEWIRGFEPRIRQVAMLTPGVDLPPVATAKSAADGTRRLLYLGRRHPLKGLDLLEEALGALDAGTVTLRIESAVFGADKAQALASCDAVVLPTLSENFALVVAEALAVGKPVIVTDAAPWLGVRENRCGWFVEGFKAGDFDRERAVVNLRRALEEFAVTPPEELAAMGARGRAWMARDFAWDGTVARLMREIG